MSDVTTTVVQNLEADSIRTDQIYSGDMIVTGAARFANGFYGSPKESTDINQVSAQTSISDNYYVIMSNGTSLFRVKFSDFVTAVKNKL